MENQGINKKTWDRNFNLLKEYIDSSDDIKKQFEAKGRINRKAFVMHNGKKVNIGRWLDDQREHLLKKYENITLAEIENDEKIKEYDKYKIKKLLELGVSKAKNIEEYNMLEWDEKFDALVKYINSSEDIKKYFNKNGGININTKVKINGINYHLGKWLSVEKQNLMSQYQGMSIEQIENNKEIPQKDKRKMLKLLNLGVSYCNQNIKWDEVFDLFIKYLNENPKDKEYFSKTGRIDRYISINKNGKKINLGVWLTTQKVYLMKKYHGMTIKQIEENENIPEEDKRKMKKLLDIGVSYTDIKEKSNEEQWDENYNLLKNYINKSKDRKEYFETTGFLDISEISEEDENIYKLSKWLGTQKAVLLKKYKDLSIEEIENDRQIPEVDKYRLKKLYEIGAFYTGEDRIEKWNEKFELLEKYINSSEEIKSNFQKRGKVDGFATIEKGGQTINIGNWLLDQKADLMKKYYGMTIEQIEEGENIPQIDKERMKKLLTLGVTYTSIHEKSYEEEWYERFQALKKHIISSESVRKYFNKKGTVKENTIVEINGKRLDLAAWIRNQKYYLIKINGGKSIENIDEIEENTNISISDKNKIKMFLDLGVNLRLQEKTYRQIWDEKFNLLEEFINSSDKIKKQFDKDGLIDREQIIKNNFEEIKIGMWFFTQRNTLMKKYQGMTVEQIEKDKSIPEEDKYRMIKLLNLGLTYPKISGQNVGKVSFDSKVEECDNAQKIINDFKLKKEEKREEKN